MITCIIIVTPEDETNHELFKRKMKYVTGSRDGTVKVWNALT
jgi:WD40 repeat protein